MERLVKWLSNHGVCHYVLKWREIENYIGVEAIAKAAGVHPSVLDAAPGHEGWHDIKAAFFRARGYRYDERRLSVDACDCLSSNVQQNLFLEENAELVSLLRTFLGGAMSHTMPC